MSRRRVPRSLIAVRALLGLVAASALVGAVPATAGAGPAPSLGGFQGSAQASGLHVFYNPEGLLPIAPPVDFGSPDALATITSGPATFARASFFDPGDLLANPDALLAQTGSVPSGTVPAYPYRATATSGVGAPTAESAPAPGLRAAVRAEPSGSSAESTMPALVTPAIATVGSMASYATTATDDATVTVQTRTEIDSFDLLGLVTIDSIVTDLTATSDGTATTLSGGTTVTGAMVLGQPVTIDADGIHASDAPNPLNDLLGGVPALLTGTLNEVLAGAGIRISLIGAVEQAGGASGRLASTGLRIDVELTDENVAALALLDSVTGSLPPLENPIPGAPSIEDLLAASRSNHLVALELGRAVVTLTARTAVPATPVPPRAPAATPQPAAATTGSPRVPTAPRPVGPAVPSPAAPSLTPTAPVAAVEPSAGSLAAGIGALAILVLLLQPFIGDRLARAVTTLLAADSAGPCPREER